jgi:hypothetical protein
MDSVKQNLITFESLKKPFDSLDSFFDAQNQEKSLMSVFLKPLKTE